MKEGAELAGGAATGGEPLREPLEEHSKFPRFKEVKNSPEKIIRPFNSRLPNENSGDIEKIVFTAKRLFEELKTKYNIDVAVDFVLAGEKDRAIGYAVADKIEGIDLRYAAKRYPDKEKIISEKVERLLLSLAGYLTDKLKNEAPFLWDIADPRQYMYGRRKKDSEDKLYLVDVDPLYYSVDKHPFMFESSMVGFLDFLTIMEGSFKTTFKDVRAELKNAWADVPAEKRKAFDSISSRIRGL